MRKLVQNVLMAKKVTRFQMVLFSGGIELQNTAKHLHKIRVIGIKWVNFDSIELYTEFNPQD